jgi:argininosuccinate lyase
MVAAHRRADVSALGAAAFAGTTLPLDAKAVADDLGFSRVFDNAADAVSDRDFALEFLAASSILGVHLSRLAEEIVLFATREFAYIEIDDAYATGSSIMPQKKNPDVAELVRAKSARITADLVHLLGVMKGLPLSYNRDLQEDKEPVFDAADSLAVALNALSGLIETLSFNRERLAGAAASGGLLATDLAEALVKQGTPFRRAHEMVGEVVAAAGRLGKELTQLDSGELLSHGINPELLTALDPESAVRARRTHGGTSPERIAEQLARMESVLENQEHWLSAHAD